MIIERTQKRVIFEEAARKGIVGSQLLQVPQIYDRLLGVTDIGVQRYGAPLTPVYNAKSGELIEIPRIANFFTGLARDIRVSDIALTEIENSLVLFNLEMWTRMQLLKNRSSDLSKKASVEKTRASLGATWVYTESFNTTNYIDMQETTAWLDTAEGIAFLPNSGPEKTIPPQAITIIEQGSPSNGNLLGSTPFHAFDGLDSTNWRCIFVSDDGSRAYAVAQFQKPTDITAMTIDPVGFGIDLLIETDSGDGFKEAVKAIIYSKKTFPIERQLVKKIKVSFKVATSVLPKTVGIRELVLYSSESIRTAEIISKLLKPSDPFTEVKIQYKGEIPLGSKITTYFRTATGDPWIKADTADWFAIQETNNASFSVSMTDSVPDTSSRSFRGLYGLAIPIGQVPLTISEGVMDVGKDMVEVSAFRKDWAEEGDIPHQLSSRDFENINTIRTWSFIPTKSFLSQGTGLVLQNYGDTTIKDEEELTRSGKVMAFQRRLNSDEFSPEITTFNQMVVVPLVGAVSGNNMQYGYNYRMRFWVHCPKQFHYNDGRYWLYQGYRKSGRRSYRDVNKSYGSFSMYVNDTLVAGETSPYTVYDDDSNDGATLGKNYSFTFNEGWNKVEVYINTYDPSLYGDDNFDAGDPYLQLSLYPCLFDASFRNHADHYISDIIASGQQKPVSEFDLLWNLPKEPTFWSWTEDRSYVLFNTNTRKTIDGYFKGDAPVSNIVFKSITASTVDDLYVRIVIEREQNSRVSPALDEYSILVR